MKVTYSPREETVQTWDWDPDRVSVIEAEAIEKRLGGDVPWDKFKLAVMQGQARARRVLLWHLLKRAHPPLRLDDVDFAVGELSVEMDRDELLAFRAKVVDSAAIDDDERDRMLRGLDAQLAETTGDTEAPGKALSKTSVAATAG